MILVPRIFALAAIVLAVFAIIAGAQTNGFWWLTTWFVWACASLLAFYVDRVWDPWYTDRRRVAPGQTVVQQAPPA